MNERSRNNDQIAVRHIDEPTNSCEIDCFDHKEMFSLIIDFSLLSRTHEDTQYTISILTFTAFN